MFILYFDKKYFRWGEQLIESIQLYESAKKVYIYGINLTDKQTFKLLRRYYNVIARLQKFDVDKPSLSHEGAPPIRKQKAPPDELRFHIIARKARFILNAMKQFPKEEVYIMLDADMLVIRELSLVVGKMLCEGYDFAGVQANPDKICGGFYVVRPTKISTAFLQEWDKFLISGDHYWDKDQPSMARIMRKHVDKGLKFLAVSRDYLDHLSRKEASIWSAHKSEFGNKDQRYSLYQKTMNERVSDKLLCRSI